MIAVVLSIFIVIMIVAPLVFPGIIIAAGRLAKKENPDVQRQSHGSPESWPFVSILIPIHGKSGIIEEKLNDIAYSDYPNERMEIILVLDGKVEGIEHALSHFRQQNDNKLKLIVLECPRSGKNSVLNRAAEKATGSILIISDADARLDSSAIKTLIASITGEDVGGGCGLHLLNSEKGAQNKYWGIESSIKAAEQKILGSVTASYGTISAVKKELFTPIPPLVADDLYTALLVVSKGKRFCFTPQSRVYIEKPSTSLLEEIRRRRRIVSQSLGTLKHFSHLMNPGRHGGYAICLLCHKLLRRLVPVNALIFLLICLWQALAGSTIFSTLALIQVSIYLLMCVLLALTAAGKSLPGPLRLCIYFFAANIGMFLGTMDFMTGKTQVIWN